MLHIPSESRERGFVHAIGRSASDSEREGELWVPSLPAVYHNSVSLFSCRSSYPGYLSFAPGFPGSGSLL